MHEPAERGADEHRVGNAELVEQLEQVGDIDRRRVIGRVGVESAAAAPAQVDREHAPVAGVAIGDRLEIARVAGQAGDAQDRRAVARPGIIAIMELQAVGAVPVSIGPRRPSTLPPRSSPPLSRADGGARNPIARPAILELGDGFYDRSRRPTFPQAIPRFLNRRWAERVGLGRRRLGARISRGSSRCPATSPQPLALRYHGHQFRHYNPDIGDGRGFLFAQLRDDRRPPARPRHQGRRADALEPARRRAADAQGRGARSARDRNARGARGQHVEELRLVRDRRGNWCAATSPRRPARRC